MKPRPSDDEAKTKRYGPLRAILLFLLLASLVATLFTAQWLHAVALEIEANSKITRDITGGVSDIRNDSESLAVLLDDSRRIRPPIEDIEVRYALARRQVDIASDDVSDLSAPRSQELFDKLVDTYDQVAALLAQASVSGEFDFVTAATLVPSLRSHSRQLVDKAFSEVRVNAAETQVSRQLETVLFILPFLSVALLFLLDRASRREMRNRLNANAAKESLVLEDNIRRQSHRITQIHAAALELVAHGKRTSEVREFLSQVVEDESNDEWELGELNVVAKSMTSTAIPEALIEMIPGILEVAADRDQIRDSLVYEARHDSLTGLANRAAITEATESAIQIPRNDHIAFLFIDLTDFKEVNDSFGHRTGDAVLSEIALRLNAECPGNGLVSRLGGDEFAMLLTDTTSIAATDVAHRVVEAVAVPISRGSVDIVVGVSIGIAFAQPEHQDSDLLMLEADQAMYHAKNTGKSVVVIDDNLRSLIKYRHGIEEKIINAIHAGSFELLYQPIVDTSTQRLVGVEALVRLRDGRRLLAPGEFLQVAEETGLIIDIDRFVIARATQQVATWNSEHDFQADLAVNLSGVHLNQNDPFETIEAAMRRSGLAMEHLTIEISEGVFLTDTDEISRKIGNLRGLGVKCAIDDFGTGYSSLAQLRRLPVDILKIDRAFIQQLGVSREDDAVVRSILDLAKAMHLHTVAEGVEKVEQHAQLDSMGCESCQGYFFGEPMTAHDIAQQWFHRVADQQRS